MPTVCNCKALMEADKEKRISRIERKVEELELNKDGISIKDDGNLEITRSANDNKEAIRQIDMISKYYNDKFRID